MHANVQMFIHHVHLHLVIINYSYFSGQASYAWKIAGFTTCTASCLGGLQESIVICVETEKENPVAPYFCDPHKRLEIEVDLLIKYFSSNISPVKYLSLAGAYVQRESLSSALERLRL